jgi:beta-glucosidase/6-phospho-beta-glucosidase/beta-galactosidase
MGEFMFATGIECSYPTIDGGRWRLDQLEATGHYQHWRRDLELVRELGLRYLRYGPPLHRVYVGPDKYDWSFTDEVAEGMRKLGITPIMDLCHFGVPDWLGNFQNPEFPKRFAEYAAAFARRYPWVKFYTPVNEMFVTARMSALDGVWNEQLRSEDAYVTATRHLAKASVLAMRAIQQERADAIFVNSESSEFYQACCPDKEIRRIADFENQRRFIALDFLYGIQVRADVYAFLLDHGMPREEYEWFMNQDVARRAVLGIDYYEWNEKLINSEGKPENLGEMFGWYVITSQYYERYRRPVMHTETNCPDANEAPGWLWRQWHNVQLIRQNGVPVLGFTWYSLQDQVDWDDGLRRALGNVFPVGLFDLNRDPRPVAQAYKHLIEMFKDEPLLAGEDVLEIR